MPTSRKLLQQVRRALVAAFVLDGFASLLQLALPLYALHVVESAIPTASLETLALLTLIAAAAAAALVCLAAARDRILLQGRALAGPHARASTCSRTARGSAPRRPRSRKTPTRSPSCRVRLTDRAVIAALDAPWLPIVLAGARAPASDHGGGRRRLRRCSSCWRHSRRLARSARLAQQKAEAGESAAIWWLAETVGPADARLPAGAADQWERLNRAHIAAAYALGRRGATPAGPGAPGAVRRADRIDRGRRLAGYRATS